MKWVSMRRPRAAGRLLALLALPAAVLLSSCQDVGDGEGGECQPCRDSAPQCDSGLYCAKFDGPFGKDTNRCAAPSTKSCPA
ncbi:MAG: hypothetical protein HY855_26675 [Burkholderiales bacterium]|nr:hypothetical protein [Burkholderiales bacterium]